MSDEHDHCHRESEWQRVAKLEVEVTQIKAGFDEIKPLVRETHQRVTQWGGIATGIAIAVSTLWGAAIAIWQFVKHKFG